MTANVRTTCESCLAQNRNPQLVLGNLQLSLLEDAVSSRLVYLDFGMKDKNPANEIRFYSKNKQDEAVPVLSHEVSHLIPKNQFKEQLVRVFLKPSGNDDVDCMRLHFLTQAFSSWCRDNRMQEPKKFVNIEATPKKQQLVPEGYVTPDRPTNVAVKICSAGKNVSKILF